VATLQLLLPAPPARPGSIYRNLFGERAIPPGDPGGYPGRGTFEYPLAWGTRSPGRLAAVCFGQTTSVYRGFLRAQKMGAMHAFVHPRPPFP
jgi:hypothetical protein